MKYAFETLMIIGILITGLALGIGFRQENKFNFSENDLKRLEQYGVHKNDLIKPAFIKLLDKLDDGCKK